jgi:hypothetical protein
VNGFPTDDRRRVVLLSKILAGLGLVLLLAALACAADTAPSDASQPLVDVLRAQKQRPVDRRAEFAAVRKTPLVAARWQSGYVLMDGEWRPFESPRLGSAAQAVRDEYVQRRAQLDGTAEAHLDLARWCHAKKLSAQEYAHSLAAVSLSPEADHRERLLKLGYRQLGDVWLSPEELAAWRAELELTKTSLDLWGEKLALVAQQLTATGRRREAADRTLDQLHDISAVPAIEWLLCGREEPIALVGIERLKSIDAYESTRALTRQAIFHHSAAARDAAMEVLIDRKLEDFVPSLLSLLTTPLTLHVDAAETADRGALFCNYVVARETENQFQIAELDSLVQFLNVDFVSTPPTPRGSVSIPLEGIDRVRTDFGRRFADERRALEKDLEDRNERTDELNARIGDVLKTVSGEEKRETPRDWWDWWNDYNQYEKPPKRTRKVTRQRRTAGAASRNPYDVRMRTSSCLVAGTVVWTDEGSRPVESLSIGDMLLSQDLESGELQYLPVLQTNARQPTTVFRLATSGEPIVATGGHRFWVNGQGWRRVNDLKPGSLLHTATGSVAITSIEPVPDQAVYNVVISPTHNYFVGEQALLTHDVTLPRSTNRKVPGLVEP